jgi:threonine dehydrogenase-like Zn-dependent dehydrogenase
MGAGTVLVTDKDDRILEIGKKSGADFVINVGKEGVADVVMEKTQRYGVLTIFDTVARPLSELLPMLARGGNLVTFAVQEREETFSTMALSGEKSITSTANFALEDFQTGIDLLSSGRVNAETIITHRFPLDQAPEAFQAAIDKETTGAVKVILKMEG